MQRYNSKSKNTKLSKHFRTVATDLKLFRCNVAGKCHNITASGNALYYVTRHCNVYNLMCPGIICR